MTEKNDDKEKKKLRKMFEWWSNPATEKTGTRGRASGGQMVGIKNSIKSDWKVCRRSYRLCLQSQELYIIT